MKERDIKAAADEKKLKNALVKRALGYNAKEVTEEYVNDEDGAMKLSKKRVVVKNVPPDLTALKYLLETEKIPVQEMTDEELEAEKTRLLKILLGEDKNDKEN